MPVTQRRWYEQKRYRQIYNINLHMIIKIIVTVMSEKLVTDFWLAAVEHERNSFK